MQKVWARVNDTWVNEAREVGIKKAQEKARRMGLEIGQAVAHPNDHIAYELKEIKGNEAIVWIPGEYESTKSFPLQELFDPNIAIIEAMREAIGRRAN